MCFMKNGRPSRNFPISGFCAFCIKIRTMPPPDGNFDENHRERAFKIFLCQISVYILPHFGMMCNNFFSQISAKGCVTPEFKCSLQINILKTGTCPTDITYGGSTLPPQCNMIYTMLKKTTTDIAIRRYDNIIKRS